jgi:protein-tyrosine phosphatase
MNDRFRGLLLASVLSVSTLAGGCSPFSIAQPPQTAPTPSFTAEITPTKDDSQRALVLQSVRNGRDLGGLVGKKGPIPLGRFIRTGSLSHATESDKTVLADHGVKLDIDLRTVWEVLRSPDRLSGDKRFHYLNVSLVGVGLWDAIYPSSRGQLYVRALAHHQAQFHRVFHAMAQQKEGTVLFHCAAGKDRTGMVAAILLDLAGVDRETIVHNYAISAKYLYPSARGAEEEAAAISESPPEAIEMFLDALDRQYGGAAAYLERIGLSRSEIDALRDRLGQ